MAWFGCYLAALVVFLGIDYLWLSKLALPFYQHHIGFLLMEKPNLLAAAGFYLLFVAAMMIFVVEPQLEKGFQWLFLFKAAFLGLVCYATYDLTNQAVVKGWPWQVTIVDMLWGAFISTVTSGFAFWFATVVLKIKT